MILLQPCSRFLAAGLLVALSSGAVTISVAQPFSGPMAIGGNDEGYDMAPETRIEVVEAAVAALPTALPPGPFQPTWESLEANYKVPQWFVEAKFGLFLHWGPYAVPAHHNVQPRPCLGAAGLDQHQEGGLRVGRFEQRADRLDP